MNSVLEDQITLRDVVMHYCRGCDRCVRCITTTPSRITVRCSAWAG